jgi:hypothetical protein
MRWYSATILSCIGFTLATASMASADEAESFRGLIPGVALEEGELAEIHGKGATFSFTLQDGSLISNDGTLGTFDQTSNQVGTTTSNSGITIPTQFVGDNNVVNVTVALEVNIGTVSVTGNNGTAVTVNQAVDLTGALDFGVGR